MNSKEVIETVLGSVQKHQLGFCQCHEHIFIADGHPAKINPVLKIDDFNKTLHELKEYKETGGDSIVDAQPIGCGRMPKYLYEASKNANVNIIASTGFHKLIYYDKNHWIHCMSDKDLANIFTNEIEKGMYVECDMKPPTRRISSKAGIIKVASDKDGVVGEYRKLFTAAAEASRLTGTSILSHTEIGRSALDQIKFLLDAGLDASSIIICHIDRDLHDINFHKAVAETGVYLELDTIGRFKYHNDTEEIQFIIKMLEYGYEDRILLGLDTTRARLKSYGGQIGLGYLKNIFIPRLMQSGVSKNIIEKLTITNPSNALVKRSDTN